MLELATISVPSFFKALLAIFIVMYVGGISFTIWTIIIAIEAREEILMEQELLPTTQEGISRNVVELETLRTVPVETNTGTRPKDSNYRGYQMVQDPPPPYSDATSGWAGVALAHPEFGSSVNPITTKGTDYAHNITASPPGFENPAASLPYTPTLKCLIKEQGLRSAYKYLKGETVNQ